MTSLHRSHGLTTQNPVRTSEESPNGNRFHRTHRHAQFVLTTDEPDPKRFRALARHRDRPAHDRPRRLRRHDCPAIGPTGAAHLRRQPPVGAYRLHPCLRRPAADRRSDGRLHGPQADVHHQPARLRRRLGARRPGAKPGHAVRRQSPPGCLRRRHGPGLTVPAHRHVHRSRGNEPGPSASTELSPEEARPSAWCWAGC